jgi:hypothetical protein
LEVLMNMIKFKEAPMKKSLYILSAVVLFAVLSAGAAFAQASSLPYRMQWGEHVQGGQVYVAWQEQPPPTAGNDIFCVVLDEVTMGVTGAGLMGTPSLGDLVRSIEVVTDDIGNACVVWDTLSAAWPVENSPALKARWITAAGVPGTGCQVYRIGMLTRPIFREGYIYVGAYCHGETHYTASGLHDEGNRFGYLLELNFSEVTPLEDPDPEPEPEQ